MGFVLRPRSVFPCITSLRLGRQQALRNREQRSLGGLGLVRHGGPLCSPGRGRRRAQIGGNDVKAAPNLSHRIWRSGGLGAAGRRRRDSSYSPTFTKSQLYALYSVTVAVMLVECAAFIGAAVMITIRRDIERWAAVAISLAGVHLLSQAIRPYLFGYPTDETMFWLQPVVMLVGGAAVWRMGSVLRAQALSGQSALSLDIANTSP